MVVCVCVCVAPAAPALGCSGCSLIGGAWRRTAGRGGRGAFRRAGVARAPNALTRGAGLTLVGGGPCAAIRCMHDEASPYYVAMVDQTTRGKCHRGCAAHLFAWRCKLLRPSPHRARGANIYTTAQPQTERSGRSLNHLDVCPPLPLLTPLHKRNGAGAVSTTLICAPRSPSSRPSINTINTTRPHVPQEKLWRRRHPKGHLAGQ